MDCTASTDLQGKAETHLYNQLRPLHGDLHATIREVLSLVTDHHDNPVKHLFRASLLAADLQHAPPDVASPPKARKSRLTLRPFRSKETSSKPANLNVPVSTFQPTPRSLPQGFSAHTDSYITEESYAQSGSISSLHGSTQTGPDDRKYNCIFCEDDYAYKGTCKRHLEQVHVARAYFKCRECGVRFKTQPEAKKHCAACGKGFTKVEPEPKKLYSSEFTRQRFGTQQQYVAHLLELCLQPKGARPERSSHLKLRNLLELPTLENAVRRTSVRLYSDVEAWRNVRWDYDRVTTAVRDLERGALDVPLDSNDLLCLHRVENFVIDLFATGRLQPHAPQADNNHTLPGPESTLADPIVKVQSPDPAPVFSGNAFFPTRPMLPYTPEQIPDDEASRNERAIQSPRDKGKRALSETSETMQQRIPAGPSRPDSHDPNETRIGDMHLDFARQQQQPHFEPQPPSTFTFNGMPSHPLRPVVENPPPYQPAWCGPYEEDHRHSNLDPADDMNTAMSSYLSTPEMNHEMTQISPGYFVSHQQQDVEGMMMGYTLDTQQQEQQHQQHGIDGSRPPEQMDVLQNAPAQEGLWWPQFQHGLR